MVRCNECGLLYVRERPADAVIDSGTVVGMHQGDSELHVNVYYNRSVRAKNMLVLRRLFPEGLGNVESWLDVGCGHGEFLETIAEFSGGTVRLKGFEPNLAKAASSRSRGLDVEATDLCRHSLQYDVVSLMNVWSHLAHPPSFIALLTGLVRPNGKLLIQTGDAADQPADIAIKPLCLPDHLSIVAERHVRTLLTVNGFEIVGIERFPALPLTATQLFKEFAKLVLPGHRTLLPHYIHWSAHSKEDMYILAVRKPGEC